MHHVLAILMLLFSFGIASVAQAWPDKPITIIVPFSAGGSTDVVARSIVPYLEKNLNTTIIVKNVSGGAATLGAAELASAKADGYTLGWLTASPVITQHFLRDLPYKQDDLTPIAMVSKSPFVVMVDKNAPWNNLGDVAKDLKAKPNKYAYGSSGPGLTTHLSLAALFKEMGVEVKHIPDRGTSEGMKSLAGGTTQFFSDATSLLGRFDVKPLALFNSERMSSLPDVPTAKEQGYDLNFSAWYGVFGPKNMPPEVVEQIAVALKKTLDDPAYQEFAKQSAVDLKYMGSKDFTEFLSKEADVYKKIIEQCGLKTQ